MNPPNAVDARVKKLERDFAKAQAEVEKLAPEIAVLDTAITHIEREIKPKLHTERLQRQNAARSKYASIARRLVEAVNLVAGLTGEAKSAFSEARAEFQEDETCEGQDPVRCFAGLIPIWDEQWVNYGGDGCRRDVVVNRVWQFGRSLVDANDPVAKNNMHQDEHRQKEYERIERERQEWTKMCKNGTTQSASWSRILGRARLSQA